MTVPKLFLSVGAMKAGTTFLYNVFRRHPALYFTPEKELHFFAHANGLSKQLQRPTSKTLLNGLSSGLSRKGAILSHEFRRHRLSMVMHNRYSKLNDADALREIVKWYSDKYLTSPIDDNWFNSIFSEVGDRYACDFSNYHSMLPSSGWDHVKRSTSKLRVIYILREPVSRLWSHIKFDLIQSGRRHELESFNLAQLEKILSATGISCHSRYGDIVQHLQNNLSPDQLKVIPFEHFIEDFDSTVREVEDFLEIEHFEYDHVDTSKKSNPSLNLKLESELRERLGNVVRPEIEKLKRLGFDLPEIYYS